MLNTMTDRLAGVQRRLHFDDRENNDILTDDLINNNLNDIAKENSNNNCISAKKVSMPTFSEFESPPYKRMKSLSFMDPLTPRSETVTASSTPVTPRPDEVDSPFCRPTKFPIFNSTPCNGRTTPPSKDVSLLSTVTMSPKPRLKCKVSPVASSSFISRLHNIAPVNPFTPSGRVIVSENRKRKQQQRKSYYDNLFYGMEEMIDNTSNNNVSDSEADTKSILGPSLLELEISRFNEEFKVDDFIANGSFGVVYKCTNFLDGVEYAIKKSAHPVAGTTSEHIARREVFAHAALRPHLHIVTYYSSWIEAGHLYIQTEYCNGGSLEKLIKDEHVFTESGLKRLTNHVAKGLKYIHSQRLAHMDIKPENIFINRVDVFETSDEEFDDDDHDDVDIIYKIGDLGHVIVVDDPHNVEDGDCRYMPKELLNENYNHLQKADIFSFGLSLFEAAGGGPLPKNGSCWQDLRNGNIPYLEKYSSHFNQTIKSMLNPEPEKRPDANYILQKTRRTAEDLEREICSYKMKRDFYAQRVHARTSCLKSLSYPSVKDVGHSPNLPKIIVQNY